MIFGEPDDVVDSQQVRDLLQGNQAMSLVPIRIIHKLFH